MKKPPLTEGRVRRQIKGQITNRPPPPKPVTKSPPVQGIAKLGLKFVGWIMIPPPDTKIRMTAYRIYGTRRDAIASVCCPNHEYHQLRKKEGWRVEKVYATQTKSVKPTRERKK